MLRNFTTSFKKKKMFPYLSVFTVWLFTVLNFLLFNAAQAMVWSLHDKTACTGHSSFSSRNFNRHFIFFSLTISFVLPCPSMSLSPMCIFIILASNLNPQSNLVKLDVIEIQFKVWLHLNVTKKSVQFQRLLQMQPVFAARRIHCHGPHWFRRSSHCIETHFHFFLIYRRHFQEEIILAVLWLLFLVGYITSELANNPKNRGI